MLVTRWLFSSCLPHPFILSFFAQMVAQELPVDSFAKATLPTGFPVLSAGDRRVTEQSAPCLLAGGPFWSHVPSLCPLQS